MTRSPFDFEGPVQIVAHRGYSARAPENTISALRLALDAGAEAVEFDLHTAGDGTPVVLHDETLRRTTDGRGRVTRHTAAELAELDAGAWFAPEFTGEPLPTLAAALDSIRDRIGTVFAEVKGVRDTADVEAVVSVTRNAGLLEKTVFISMDWALLDEVRKHAPEAFLGPIVDHRRRVDDAFARVEGDDRSLLDFDARILLRRPEIAERAHDAAVPLAVWTVDDAATASRLLSVGVRRITTNQVGRLLDWASTLPR